MEVVDEGLLLWGNSAASVGPLCISHLVACPNHWTFLHSQVGVQRAAQLSWNLQVTLSFYIIYTQYAHSIILWLHTLYM